MIGDIGAEVLAKKGADLSGRPDGMRRTTGRELVIAAHSARVGWRRSTFI